MSAPGVGYRTSGAPVQNGHGSGSTRPHREIRRRRNLPGGRAVAGGLLVGVAAVGLYAAYAGMNGRPSSSYVVTSRPIDAGTKIELGDLAMEPIDLPPRVRARAFDDPSVLVGATAVTKLEPGELVQPSAVVAKAGDDPGRELSFPVERGHLSTTLEEGESVDLLATFGSGNESFTTMILQDAQVVSIERAKAGLGDNGTAVVAVIVADARDEVALAHAIQQGKLTVVRATGAPPAQHSPVPYQPEPPGSPASRGGPARDLPTTKGDGS